MSEHLAVVRTALRVLAFRADREELVALDRRHLAFGLACTWIVGMGRYWDHPRAVLLQHLGVGSVVYVFVLAALLWFVIRWLGPRDWSYERVLTFVTLTSPPAALYAFPIERFVVLDTANAVNAWFLAAVAAWRVALLVWFLRRLGALTWPRIVVGTLLPLSLVVTSLAALNLEHVVFRIMGGITETERSASDAAYGVVVMLTFLSVYAFLPLVISWIVLSRRRPPGSMKPDR